MGRFEATGEKPLREGLAVLLVGTLALGGVFGLTGCGSSSSSDSSSGQSSAPAAAAEAETPSNSTGETSDTSNNEQLEGVGAPGFGSVESIDGVETESESEARDPRIPEPEIMNPDQEGYDLVRAAAIKNAQYLLQLGDEGIAAGAKSISRIRIFTDSAPVGYEINYVMLDDSKRVVIQSDGRFSGSQ
jgi:hypothetical protein